MVQKFTDTVRMLSGGRIDITPFGVGEIVPAFKVHGEVAAGTVDAGWISAAFLANADPTNSILANFPGGPSPETYLHWYYKGGGAGSGHRHPRRRLHDHRRPGRAPVAVPGGRPHRHLHRRPGRGAAGGNRRRRQDSSGGPHRDGGCGRHRVHPHPDGRAARRAGGCAHAGPAGTAKASPAGAANARTAAPSQRPKVLRSGSKSPLPFPILNDGCRCRAGGSTQTNPNSGIWACRLLAALPAISQHR